MQYKVTAHLKNDFISLVKKTCERFKVHYTINVSDLQEIYKIEKEIYTWEEDVTCENGKIYKSYPIMGYVIEIDIPELSKIKDTGYKYLGCIKNDPVTVFPTPYAEKSQFQLSSLHDEIKEFPCVECNKKKYKEISFMYSKARKVRLKLLEVHAPKRNSGLIW